MKLFKKVVLLSALEWKGISNKVTFDSNRGIESFIMFERQNMPKMWESYVAFLGGFATFQKIDTDRNVGIHQYPDIIAKPR